MSSRAHRAIGTLHRCPRETGYPWMVKPRLRLRKRPAFGPVLRLKFTCTVYQELGCNQGMTDFHAEGRKKYELEK